jgi:hypothetical protein
MCSVLNPDRSGEVSALEYEALRKERDNLVRLATSTHYQLQGLLKKAEYRVREVRESKAVRE